MQNLKIMQQEKKNKNSRTSQKMKITLRRKKLSVLELEIPKRRFRIRRQLQPSLTVESAYEGRPQSLRLAVPCAARYAPQGSSKNSDALRDRSSSQGNNAKLLVRGGSKCHPFSTLNPETLQLTHYARHNYRFTHITPQLLLIPSTTSMFWMLG